MEEAQVQAGSGSVSRIVRAIQDAEKGTTGEVRVHLSKRWLERDPLARARKLFKRFGMERTTFRNAVLIYVNLRKRRLAIVGDNGIHEILGPRYWETVATRLARDLRRTHHENAIAAAVREVGIQLARHFPAEAGAENPDELSNEVTRD